VDYRAATPADEPFLRAMLWHAYNWRDESAAEDHWPDPDGPRRYVEGFGRPGDAGVIADEGGEPAGAAWYRLPCARSASASSPTTTPFGSTSARASSPPAAAAARSR
jgi:hypothetical protein